MGRPTSNLDLLEANSRTIQSGLGQQQWIVGGNRVSRGSRLDDGFTWKMTEPKQRDAVASVRKGKGAVQSWLGMWTDSRLLPSDFSYLRQKIQVMSGQWLTASIKTAAEHTSTFFSPQGSVCLSEHSSSG